MHLPAPIQSKVKCFTQSSGVLNVLNLRKSELISHLNSCFGMSEYLRESYPYARFVWPLRTFFPYNQDGASNIEKMIRLYLFFSRIYIVKLFIVYLFVQYLFIDFSSEIIGCIRRLMRRGWKSFLESTVVRVRLNEMARRRNLFLLLSKPRL